MAKTGGLCAIAKISTKCLGKFRYWQDKNISETRFPGTPINSHAHNCFRALWSIAHKIIRQKT